jgi:MFS family permease
MLALGLNDKQIGSIISISWTFQIFLALISGVITDKLGRRLTTLIFDIISWSIPALISAIAQNYWYFLAAGIINSVWQITHNSWNCLLVEDAKPNQLADIYTWIYIANLMVGFVAPLTGVLIGAFSLIPTIRGLYIFAVIMFTIKAVVTYQMTEETAQGKVRMHETRHQSPFNILSEYKGVFRDLLRSPQTLYTAGIMLVISITMMINTNFWAIIVTQKLHIPDQGLAIFPFVRSAIILLFFFTVTPRLNKLQYQVPMAIGFLGFVVSQMILITAPIQSYLFLILSVFLEGCSFAMVNPLVDQMTALTVDPQERARILSILYVGIILLTSPFGWIAGTLSGIDKNLPFILNISLFVIGALLAYLAKRASQESVNVEATSYS